MARRIFIHATNVHQGGGAVLLSALLTELSNKNNVLCFADSRMVFNKKIVSNINIRKIRPSIFGRLIAEMRLKREVRDGDVVLCFGNLPPLFKLNGYVLVFLQNRYLLTDSSLKDFSLRIALRITLERLWLGKRVRNANEFIVQTQSMLALLITHIKNVRPIGVFPFVATSEGYSRGAVSARLRQNYKYLYVASGEPHKNHQTLVDAWRLLANEGIFPSLTLTFDKCRFPVLTSMIDNAINDGELKIDNVGEVSNATIKNLYRCTDALIYPSIFESFGLPLIEARQAGLDILASELDYVRDILDPEQTFNPESATSIAKAIKRHMGIREPALPLKSAAEFAQYLSSKAR